MMQMIAEFHGAKYIKADEAATQFSFYDPIPFFRKEIEIKEPIVSAELLVQGRKLTAGINTFTEKDEI